MVFFYKRRRDTRKFGSQGSVIEFDGLFYGNLLAQQDKHIKQKQDKPDTDGDLKMKIKNYNWLCLFRMVERDTNVKGGHLVKSWICRTESVEECLYFVEKNAVPGAKLSLDGCGFGESKIMQKKFDVDQCNHSRRVYLKPGSLLEGTWFKTHDQNAERQFRNIREYIRASYGIRLTKGDAVDPKAVRSMLIESDWLCNYTNNDPVDCIAMYVTHMGQYVNDVVDMKHRRM